MSYAYILLLEQITRVQEGKRGVGAAAVFVARNRFAVLDKATNNILVKNLRNEVTKQCASPLPVTDSIFYAGTGLLLCRCDDKVGVPAKNICSLSNNPDFHISSSDSHDAVVHSHCARRSN